MTGSADERATDPATQWRIQSRYYRRPPGWGWLLGLLLIPILFGWLGWGAVKPTVSVSAPSSSVSTTALPSLSAPASQQSPLSIVRNGNDFTVTAELPDLSVKDKLLGSLEAVLGPGVNLIDKLTIKDGVSAPEITGIGPVFKAANDIGDFAFNLAGTTLTLTGSAPSDQVRGGVEAAAKAGWPGVRIVDSIEVRDAPAAAGSCGNLQTDIDSALREPIAYRTEGSDLTEATKAELTAVAAAIKACPDARIAVIGHTDNTGDDTDNDPLSRNRARSVADYLISQGVPAGSVTATGAGSSQPVASNDTADGRARNRRTEITVN